MMGLADYYYHAYLQTDGHDHIGITLFRFIGVYPRVYETDEFIKDCLCRLSETWMQVGTK